jgi:hypothetical protein
MMGLGLRLPIEKTASGGASPPTVAPVNTVLPIITGTGIVPNFLSVSNGTWTGFPTPTFTYLWLRDAATIGGATASLYQLVSADATHSISAKVTATNAGGSATVNSSNTVVVTQTTLVYSPVTVAVRGAAYTGATPVSSGGTAPYLYTISSGTLPTGLNVSSGTGIITGTPSVAGAQAGLVLTSTDSNAIAASSSAFTITVTQTTLTYTPVTTGTVGVAYTGATPSVSGGTAPYVYTISAGTLPSGLSIASGTGIITGTPLSAGASSGLVLTVTDANGIADNSTPFTITIVSGSAGSSNSFPGTLIGGV